MESGGGRRPPGAGAAGALDLQDDLAETVIWLAEHWSADLPAPSSSGTGSPAAVRLIAYCLSADELDRAAARLGVPLVDDVAPDSYGARYRRATRRFGRVELEAYRALEAVCAECGTALAGQVCPTCGERADARPVTVGAA